VTIKYENFQSNGQIREAVIDGGDFDGDREEQILVPNYLTDDIIEVTQSRNGTDVVVAGEQLSWIDTNRDARAWARSRVI